ncbi:hypothetical protein [Flammeovirga aprica]|uniref:Uncharacterized protein n=1 Tax=Flammeovirga aprica JL-4 TaxID=694437 RepID=A0A7X9XBU9_9BACT|nr:hypothetical protein [Flammeovirga aprica]NME71127.1 hypothetical protein [Flammeovirga aprica JL-4]
MNTFDKNHLLRSKKVQELLDQELPWMMRLGILVILILVLFCSLFFITRKWDSSFEAKIELHKKTDFVYKAKLKMPLGLPETISEKTSTYVEMSHINGGKHLTKILNIDSILNINNEIVYYYVTLESVDSVGINVDSILDIANVEIPRSLSNLVK